MKLKVVIIFAHECAPFNRSESTIGAQRPAQFAKWLPEHGWRAIVICCDASRRREIGRAGLNGVREEVRTHLSASDPARSLVLPTPSLTSDGPVDALFHRLTTEGALGLPGALAVRKLTTLSKLFTGDYSQAWQPCARAAAEEIASTERVAACVGEHSPDAGLYLARWFSRRFNVPWVADFRDPVLRPFGRVVRAVYRPWVRHLLRDAACTINVNSHCVELDRDLFRRPAECIPNGFDPDDYSSCVEERSGNDLHVLYLGSVDPSFQRMEIFLDGLRALQEAETESADRVRFTYIGGAAEAIRSLADERGLGGTVRTIGRLDRPAALAAAADSDVLLVLGAVESGRDETLRRGVVPGKAFEYLGLRRPILCVPSDRGLLDEFLAETRAGTTADTPTEVARFLEEAVRRIRHGQRLEYRPDAEAVVRYTRQEQAGKLARVLDRCVRDR